MKVEHLWEAEEECLVPNISCFEMLSMLGSRKITFSVNRIVKVSISALRNRTKKIMPLWNIAFDSAFFLKVESIGYFKLFQKLYVSKVCFVPGNIAKMNIVEVFAL